MRRYLLDSNALNLFVFRRSGVYDRSVEARRGGATIGTAIPVVAELLGGTLFSASSGVNLPRVTRGIRLLRVSPFDMPAALEYARPYATLRPVGVEMQAIDLMIAAVAMTLSDCTVVTSDGDFRRVPGLRVADWAG